VIIGLDNGVKCLHIEMAVLIDLDQVVCHVEEHFMIIVNLETERRVDSMGFERGVHLVFDRIASVIEVLQNEERIVSYYLYSL
jgi:hypothetical protein